MTPNQQRVLDTLKFPLLAVEVRYEVNKRESDELTYSQVFALLSFLCDRGLVVKHDRKYQITEAGQSALRDLAARETKPVKQNYNNESDDEEFTALCYYHNV